MGELSLSSTHNLKSNDVMCFLTVQISLQRCFVTDRQRDRQTDGQTDRQMDRQKQSLNPASAYARGVITTALYVLNTTASHATNFMQGILSGDSYFVIGIKVLMFMLCSTEAIQIKDTANSLHWVATRIVDRIGVLTANLTLRGPWS